MSITTASSLGLADPRLRTDLARTVGRRIDAADIDDVVQSTLAEALAARALPKDEEEIRRFVFAIARQKVADWYRRRSRESRRELPEQTSVNEPAAAGGDLLRWAVAEVPPIPEARRTFEWMLREGEGETLAEIASAERVAAPVVRQRVSRLRRYLKARWAKELAGLTVASVIAIALGYSLLERRSDHAEIPAADPSARRDPTGERMRESEGAQHAPAPSVTPTTPPPAPTLAPAPSSSVPSLPPPKRAPAAPPATPRDRADPWGMTVLTPPSTHRTLNRTDPWGASTPLFSPASASAALAGVDVRGCATPGTPSGSSHVTVTFAPEGAVSAATIDGGVLKGRPEAACVEARFRLVRIAPFDGAPVRVGKSIDAHAAPPSAPSTPRDSSDPWASAAPPIAPSTPRDSSDPWASAAPPTSLPSVPAASSTGAAPPFDGAAAERRVRGLDLRQCLVGRTQTTTATLTLTFEPTGRVSRVQWNDAAADREQNACVMGIVSVLRVPAWSGRSGVVRASASIDGENLTWTSIDAKN